MNNKPIELFNDEVLRAVYDLPNKWAACTPASGNLTSVWISLHTGPLDDTSVQTTNEISYAGYARTPISRRDAMAWMVTEEGMSPSATIPFNPCLGGIGGLVTHFAIGDSASGEGKIFYFDEVFPQIRVTSGDTPQLTTKVMIPDRVPMLDRDD